VCFQQRLCTDNRGREFGELVRECVLEGGGLPEKRTCALQNPFSMLQAAADSSDYVMNVLNAAFARRVPSPHAPWRVILFSGLCQLTADVLVPEWCKCCFIEQSSLRELRGLICFSALHQTLLVHRA
jgi:hypothetical protein